MDEILETLKMSKEAVNAFYAFLERTPEVRLEALSIKDRFEEQEDQMRELIRIAEKNGFSFTMREYVQFLYERSV